MIYFLQEDSPEQLIKIGFTEVGADYRRSSCQTGNPRPLRVLAEIRGTKADEHHLHDQFQEFRVDGEWFKPGPTLLAFINGVNWTGSERLRIVVDDAANNLSSSVITQDANYKEAVHDHRTQMVLDAIEQAGGNKTKAARALGITTVGLYKILNRAGFRFGSDNHVRAGQASAAIRWSRPK